MKSSTHVRPGWKSDRIKLEVEMSGQVGLVLRRLRGKRTADAAAAAIGIARPIYSRTEAGKHMPTLSVLVLAITGLGGDPGQEIRHLVEQAIPAALRKKRA